MGFQYYRSKLAYSEHIIYNIIYNGLMRYEKNIVVKGNNSINRIKEISQSVINDNPEIFFIDTIEICIYSEKTEIIPKYRYGVSDIRNLAHRCQLFADKAISRLPRQSDYDLAMRLHDAVTRNVCYMDDGKDESHTIISPLIHNTGVCDGYSKTYKYLLDMTGIACICVSGSAYDPQSRSMGPHAWNMVRLSGEWVHMDVTFDSTVADKGVSRYDYFALSDKSILIDHSYLKTEYPVSTIESLSYYIKNNLIMINQDSLVKYTKDCIRKGIMSFVIKLPEDVPIFGLCDKVLNTVSKAMTESFLNGSIQIGMNEMQRVFHVMIS